MTSCASPSCFSLEKRKATTTTTVRKWWSKRKAISLLLELEEVTCHSMNSFNWTSRVSLFTQRSQKAASKVSNRPHRRCRGYLQCPKTGAGRETLFRHKLISLTLKKWRQTIQPSNKTRTSWGNPERANSTLQLSQVKIIIRLNRWSARTLNILNPCRGSWRRVMKKIALSDQWYNSESRCMNKSWHHDY